MPADTYISNVLQTGHYNNTDIIYGLVRNASKQVRDVVNGNWEAFPGSGSLDDYDISAATGSGGLWSGDFPVIANGFYVYQFRIRTGATPDFSDSLIFSLKGYWNGSIFTTSSQILNEEVDNDGTAISLRQAIRLILSILTAKTSGGGTTTLVFRDINDTKNRLSVTVDANGNRTAVITRDGT